MALDFKQLSTLMKDNKKEDDDEKLIDKIRGLFDKFTTEPLKNLKETLKEKLSYDMLDKKQKDIADKVIDQNTKTRECIDNKFGETGLVTSFSKLWKNSNFVKTFTDTYTKVVDKVKGFFSIKKALAGVKDKVFGFTKSFFDVKTLIMNPKKWLGSVVKDLVSSIWTLFLAGIKIISKLIFSALKPLFKAVWFLTKFVIKMFVKIMFQFFMMTIRFFLWVAIQTFLITFQIIGFIIFTVIPFLFSILGFIVFTVLPILVTVFVKVLVILAIAVLIVAAILLIVWGILWVLDWLFGGEIFETLMGIVEDALKLLWDWLKNIWDMVIDFLEWIISGQFITDIVENVTKAIKYLFVDLPKMLFENMEEFLGLPKGWFKNTLMSIVSWIGDVLKKTIDFFNQLFFSEDGTFYERLKKMVLAPLKEFISELWQDIKNIWNTFKVWLNKQEWFQKLMKSVDWVKEKLEWIDLYIIQPALDLITKAWEYLQGLMGKIKNWWKGIWENMKGFFDKIFNPIKKVLSAIISGLNKLPGVNINDPFTKGAVPASLKNAVKGPTKRESDLIDLREEVNIMSDEFGYVSGDKTYQERISALETIIKAPNMLSKIKEIYPKLDEQKHQKLLKFAEEYKTKIKTKSDSLGVQPIKLAVGGVVTDTILAAIAEQYTPEMVIPLDQRGLSFVTQIWKEMKKVDINNEKSTETNSIVGKIKEAVGDSIQVITNPMNSIENKMNTMVESFKEIMTKDKNTDKPQKGYEDSAAAFRNQGNLSDNDVKNDMARMIAMGFVGPKRF